MKGTDKINNRNDNKIQEYTISCLQEKAWSTLQNKYALWGNVADKHTLCLQRIYASFYWWSSIMIWLPDEVITIYILINTDINIFDIFGSRYTFGIHRWCSKWIKENDRGQLRNFPFLVLCKCVRGSARQYNKVSIVKTMGWLQSESIFTSFGWWCIQNNCNFVST